MSDTPTIYIVTVHYGDVSTTQRCLDALSRLTVRPHVVISNNDTPEKGAALINYIENLGDSISAEVTQNRDNRGFAAGCNVGIRKAMEADADYVWLLNNDTEAEPDSLRALLDCAEATPRALLGSTVVEMDDPEIIQVAGGVAYNPWTTIIRPGHVGSNRKDATTLPTPPMDYIYGASMFIPTALFREIGLMDEAYFLYYEELDLCTRAIKQGWKLDWCRQSCVRHEGGAATGVAGKAKTDPNPQMVFHDSASFAIFSCKHHPLKAAIALPYRIVGRSVLFILRRQYFLVPHVLKGTPKGLLTSIKANNMIIGLI